MRKERKEIGLGFLHRNEGQLVWLPKNPRQWTQTDIDRTAESIKRDTDFLEDRPLLVVALDKRDYIVFAGNLRYTGAVAAKLSKAPAVVYTPEGDEDEETIRRRALLDNGSFGSWDWDEVFSGPWGTMDLEALGIGKAFQEYEHAGEGDNGGGVEPGVRPDTGVRGSLSTRFLVPPFTILDTRKGEWKTRKAEWRERIGDNGESREHTLAGGVLYRRTSPSWTGGGTRKALWQK